MMKILRSAAAALFFCMPVGADDMFSDAQKRHWAFQPVKAPAVPKVRDADWAKGDLDRFILSGLEAKGMAPARRAGKATLLRRASFGLTGLPPTPAEIDAFLKDDTPEAFAKVVDRLLESPRYGERWGRHWLDLARYADARDPALVHSPSDFREAWRYRDWVVKAINKDMPFADFLRHQVAGDLLPPPKPGEVNKDGLIATGFLALADFAPGDDDKNRMLAAIADEQTELVGRTFLGLSLSCARCHDHPSDPLRQADYDGLAGMFRSSRIVAELNPGPSPLLRVALASPGDAAREEKEQKRRDELLQQLPGAFDRAFLEHVESLVGAQTARYAAAAAELRQLVAHGQKPDVPAFAKRLKLHDGYLAGWMAYLERLEPLSAGKRPAALRDAARGKPSVPALERLQRDLAAQAKARAAEPPEKRTLDRALLHRFRADDPQLEVDKAGQVTRWPNRGAADAAAAKLKADAGPVKAEVKIAGHAKTVLRFDGSALLESAGQPPPHGSLFVVYRTADGGHGGQRLVGWEDSDVGQHGLGVIAEPGGGLHVVVRNQGNAGDIADGGKADGFQMLSVSWGSGMAAVHRDGKRVGDARLGMSEVSADPAIAALRLGGPGSGGAPRFAGDIAELRIYGRPASDAERRKVEAELRDAWFKPSKAKPDPIPQRDVLADLFAELASARGPFWVPSWDERSKLIPEAGRAPAEKMREELMELFRRAGQARNEFANAIQEGGLKGSRFEGFKSSRRLPAFFAGDKQPRIGDESGRRQLADWLASKDNPLPARVMANRVWQRHFGAGLSRTPDDFGLHGDTPSHPELLDWLAARFLASGGSMKALHRLILLSATWQQGAGEDRGAAQDPDNRLFGRMSRRRLEFAAVRDRLFMSVGRLDFTPLREAFGDPNAPHRTLFMQSIRNGPAMEFASKFDRSRQGEAMPWRSDAAILPASPVFQADATALALAKELSHRALRDAPAGGAARVRFLYAAALGRTPTAEELAHGVRETALVRDAESLERYCQQLLFSEEFLQMD